MVQEKTCCCASGLRLIFACSGAADVGELADQAARKLARDGFGKMFCTAGIGGGIPGIVQATKSAGKIVAVDGCGLDCVKLLLEKAGFTNVEHVCLADYGFIKGQTLINEETMGKVADLVREKLQVPIETVQPV